LKDKAYAFQKSTLDHTVLKVLWDHFFWDCKKIFLLLDRFDWIRLWDICKKGKKKVMQLLCFANQTTLTHFLPLNHCAVS